MKANGGMVICVMFLFAVLSEAAPPVLPCKTPDQLLLAVKHALTTQDTNFLWSLVCWTNVPPRSERSYKAVHLVHFKGPTDDRVTYGEFRLIPATPDDNAVRRRKDGTEIRPNIPVTGLVAYRRQTKSRLPTGESFNGKFAGDLEYGKAPDGSYCLAVMIHIPPTNSPSSSQK